MDCIVLLFYAEKEFLDIFHNDKNATNLWESENKENELNKIQKKAIKLALVNRFQLIQGPPGLKIFNKDFNKTTMNVNI